MQGFKFGVYRVMRLRIPGVQGSGLLGHRLWSLISFVRERHILFLNLHRCLHILPFFCVTRSRVTLRSKNLTMSP